MSLTRGRARTPLRAGVCQTTANADDRAQVRHDVASFSVAVAGVRRISFASSLYRAAMTGLLNAAKEIKGSGTFDYLDRTMTTPELNACLGG